jgi:hypothetical protein
MTQFDRFKAYMDAPCHELHESDAGRNDPHRLVFKEWGVPEEFLLWLWQAAEAAAMESAASLCEEMADGWRTMAQGGCGSSYDIMAEAGGQCADEIRALKDQS